MDPLTDICFSGFCGFKVEGCDGFKDDGTYDEDFNVIKTTMNDYGFLRSRIGQKCRSKSIIRMQYWETILCSNYGITDYSCAPKMDKYNKIHIYVQEISPQCPVKILNAEIVDPTETTTMLLTTTIRTTTTEETENALLPWYIWVIIFIVLIILLIFVL
uniref:Uncharacterized protein n=1 Tax=Panagrolaimus davidi TaxID=227884 RepID=A0A914Q016_9BILA